MGYLVIDDRVSGGGLKEHDTTSCCHCQAIIKKVGDTFQGYWCGHCGRLQCPACKKTGVCRPWMKRIEERLRDQARQRANARALGI